MSKITNDGLTRSDTGCFIVICTRMATVGVKGLMSTRQLHPETVNPRLGH